jgi:hypothetical protein
VRRWIRAGALTQPGPSNPLGDRRAVDPPGERVYYIRWLAEITRRSGGFMKGWSWRYLLKPSRIVLNPS